MKYYTSLEHILAVYDRIGRGMPAPESSLEELSAWQIKARQKLSDLLALDMYEKCDPQPELLETAHFDGYTREKTVIYTESDVRMPLYILRPDADTPRPAFIVLPGHGPGKIHTVGYLEDGSMQDTFALSLARAGYVVVCPDPRGMGERREYTRQDEDYSRTNTHAELNHTGITLGLPLLGMMVWDYMRLIDYVLSLPCCDGRIGTGGMSGGGNQSIFLSALDTRISCTVTSGWFYGFRGSLLERAAECACNYVPGLFRCFDCCDIGSMIAPRPLHIETGALDPLNGKDGLDNVYPEVQTAKNSFRLYGAEDALLHYVHPGAHKWVGKYALGFVQKHMPIEN